MAKVEIIQQKGYNFLWIDDYLWMWDIPVEQEAQKEISDQCSGDILIAGYGLGILQRMLAANPAVTSITTIELLPEVITEVKKIYGEIYGQVEFADFYKIESDRKYDFVIGDIWEDIAPLALDKYVTFKNQAEKFLKPGGKVLAWGQEFFEALIGKK
jgi:spermidine synthase